MRNKRKYYILKAVEVILFAMILAGLVIFVSVDAAQSITKIVIIASVSLIAVCASAVGITICEKWLEYYKRHLDE